MRRKRRLRRDSRNSARPHGEVDPAARGRREVRAILVILALVLIGLGGFVLLLANHTETVVRRFSGPVIDSASDLRRAVDGQPVVLRGRIDPRTPTAAWKSPSTLASDWKPLRGGVDILLAMAPRYGDEPGPPTSRRLRWRRTRVKSLSSMNIMPSNNRRSSTKWGGSAAPGSGRETTSLLSATAGTAGSRPPRSLEVHGAESGRVLRISEP